MPADADGWTSVAPRVAPSRADDLADDDVPAINLSALLHERCAVTVDDGHVVVRLFETSIFVLQPNGSVRLSSGGWLTNRTHAGIAAAPPPDLSRARACLCSPRSIISA